MTAYGGRDLYSADENRLEDLRLMKAGIILFIGIFTVTVVLAVVTMLRVHEQAYRTERTATICALLSVPFMSVRLAFSAGSLFSGRDSVLNPLANSTTGIWLHLFMVIVMEYVLVLSATAVALTARRAVGQDGLKEDSSSESDG